MDWGLDVGLRFLFFPCSKPETDVEYLFMISTAVYRSGGAPLSKARLHINYLPCKYCKGCGIRALEVVSDHKISLSPSNVSITNLAYLYFQNGRHYSQSDLTLPRSKQMFLKLKKCRFFSLQNLPWLLSSPLLEKMVFKKKSIVLKSQLLVFDRIFVTALEIVSPQIQDLEDAILWLAPHCKLANL